MKKRRGGGGVAMVEGKGFANREDTYCFGDVELGSPLVGL